MKTLQERLSASVGTRRVTAATFTRGENITTLIAPSEATITICNGYDDRGNAVDFTSAPYNWSTLDAGMPFAVPLNFVITEIESDVPVLCY